MVPTIGELVASGLKRGDKIKDTKSGRMGKVVEIKKVSESRKRFDGTHEVYVEPPITYKPDESNIEQILRAGINPANFEIIKED